MLDDRRIAIIYHDYVVAHDLERTVLLDELRARCGGSPAVLYPGSFVHLTPSFYFQHVIYVDRSDFSRNFFANERGVLAIVNGRKKYRQGPFIRFIHQDFTQELPFPQGSFDVLLALYAGGISRTCSRYVKPGGLLLTNDHQGDAREAAALPDMELCAVVEERRGRVRFSEDLDRYNGSAEADLRRRNRKPKVNYYLLRKLPQPRSSSRP